MRRHRDNVAFVELDLPLFMRDHGITQVGMRGDYGSLAHEDVMRSLEVFAKEILPKARELWDVHAARSERAMIPVSCFGAPPMIGSVRS